MMERLLKFCGQQISPQVDTAVMHAAPNDEMAIDGGGGVDVSCSSNTHRRWDRPDTARHDDS